MGHRAFLRAGSMSPRLGVPEERSQRCEKYMKPKHVVEKLGLPASPAVSFVWSRFCVGALRRHGSLYLRVQPALHAGRRRKGAGAVGSQQLEAVQATQASEQAAGISCRHAEAHRRTGRRPPA
eukprot:5745405-Prymnesium_polylepis.1